MSTADEPPRSESPASRRTPSASIPPPRSTVPSGPLSTSKRTSLVRIVLDPGTSSLDDVQSFLSVYMTKRFRPTHVQGLLIASYELVENGLKYGSLARPVVLEIFEGDGGPELEVSNASIPSRLSQLMARVTALSGGAEAVYLEEFRKTMTPNGPRAMLGLARVAHEGHLSLTCELTDDLALVRARTLSRF